jgi:hypothetical protein
MKKKPSVIHFPNPETVAQPDHRHWHNGGDIEIMMYARSLHRAAKSLIASLDLQPNPVTAWDACPVVLLYRQAVELQLKALVGEGSNYLPSPTDPLTLYKTHSLRWLAQIVCQIIRAVKWESEFKCEGVSSLANFSALVNELEALDPVACAVRSVSRDGSVPPQLQPPNVVQFAKNLDGLIDLLDATADALAAEGDLRTDAALEAYWPDGTPTIQ